ncbi:MAG: DUF4350 domain-containing protein [Candidatus Pacebacteria bacterium]|nr:DUF4350 domain-containing protein [Candidatus Paceibacterota bacterium]
MRRNVLTAFLLCSLAVSMLLGLGILLHMRFWRGDVYPPYSSLRSDPIGTRALVDSLGRLPSVSVRRIFKPLSRVDLHGETTLFYFGVSPGFALEEREMRDLTRFVYGGGRLVIALRGQSGTLTPETPVQIQAAPAKEDAGDGGDASRDDGEGGRDQMDSNPDANAPKGGQRHDEALPRPDEWRRVPVVAHWDVAVSELPEAERGSGEARRMTTPDAGLARTIPWHAQYFFSESAREWSVVYALMGSEKRPVVLRRNVGEGAIVLCADSYLFSNEAMRGDRTPTFLQWISGGRSRIAVDETHFAIQVHTGVAALAREYGLVPFVVALLALCALFVWRNAVGLVPPCPDDDGRRDGAVAAAKSSFSGLVSLLRRSVSRDRLVEVCVRTWRQTLLSSRADADELEQTVGQTVERCREKHLSPRDTYIELQNELKERMKPWNRKPHS